MKTSTIRLVAIAIAVGAAVAWLISRGPGGDFEGPYGREVADAIPRIEEATGLKFKAQPKVVASSREEIRAFLLKKFDETSPKEQIAGEGAAYKAFGLLPDTLDLWKFLLATLTEQVAGYYDPKTKTLYVQKDASDDMLSITITHELVHALQDQYTNLDSIQTANTSDNDKATAAQAIIEGEATFEQMSILAGGAANIATRIGGRDRMREMIRENASSMPVFATAPMIIQESLLFPYLSGADFAQRFRDRRGKVSIFTDVPRSTEQILQTDAFFNKPPDEPSVVSLPAPRGVTKVYENNLGEFGVRLFLFAHTKDQRTAARAATGWDGDRYVIVKSGAGTGVVWASVWDSTVEAAEFTDALIRATTRRTGVAENREPGGGATFYPKGRRMSVTPRIVNGQAVVIFVDLPEGMSGVIDPAAIKVDQR